MQNTDCIIWLGPAECDQKHTDTDSISSTTAHSAKENNKKARIERKSKREKEQAREREREE